MLSFMTKIERNGHQKLNEIFMTKLKEMFMKNESVHQKLEDKFMIKIE